MCVTLRSMKNLSTRFLLPVLICVLWSCKDDAQRAEAALRAQKKQEKVFEDISRSWQFQTTPSDLVSQQLLAEWPEWQSFVNELSRKPQSTIGAFRRKAKTLSLRVAALERSVPPQYNKPQVRARIGVLTTKINALNLFVNLQEIPQDKVVPIIQGINKDMRSLQLQIDELQRKSRIPKEIGEEEMIRMLDTSRAVK